MTDEPLTPREAAFYAAHDDRPEPRRRWRPRITQLLLLALALIVVVRIVEVFVTGR